MKTYACVVTIDMDEDCPMGNPVDWSWSALVGPDVRVGPVTVIDVTDEPIERLRISADGVEEIL